MKRIISTILIAVFCFLGNNTSKAQTAMDFNQLDCRSFAATHHLFADLDSGHAVLLHFFMTNCSMCPPPAQVLQAMAQNVNASHPGLVKGYAFPFNNTTTCASTNSWVSTNSLTFYIPMDSGAAQVTNYGGFGMPTVVLLGGADHRVMYSSLAFTTSDTTAIRDSILALYSSLHSPTGINALPTAVSSFSIYPNPASDAISVTIGLKETSNLTIEVLDMTGRVVTVLLNEKQNAGIVNKNFNVSDLANGNYLIRLNVNDQSTTGHICVAH